MSGLHSSAGNNAGCPSGPHEPGTTSTAAAAEAEAERALMRENRVSSAIQPSNAHVTDRLIHQLPLASHTQSIRAQVDGISTLLPTSNGSGNGGN